MISFSVSMWSLFFFLLIGEERILRKFYTLFGNQAEVERDGMKLQSANDFLKKFLILLWQVLFDMQISYQEVLRKLFNSLWLARKLKKLSTVSVQPEVFVNVRWNNKLLVEIGMWLKITLFVLYFDKCCNLISGHITPVASAIPSQNDNPSG